MTATISAPGSITERDSQRRHDGVHDQVLASAAVPKLRVLNVERMLATEPPPVPWIAAPLLVRENVTMPRRLLIEPSGEVARLDGITTTTRRNR